MKVEWMKTGFWLENQIPWKSLFTAFSPDKVGTERLRVSFYLTSVHLKAITEVFSCCCSKYISCLFCCVYLISHLTLSGATIKRRLPESRRQVLLVELWNKTIPQNLGEDNRQRKTSPLQRFLSEHYSERYQWSTSQPATLRIYCSRKFKSRHPYRSVHCKRWRQDSELDLLTRGRRYGNIQIGWISAGAGWFCELWTQAASSHHCSGCWWWSSFHECKFWNGHFKISKRSVCVCLCVCVCVCVCVCECACVQMFSHALVRFSVRAVCVWKRWLCGLQWRKVFRTNFFQTACIWSPPPPPCDVSQLSLACVANI